MEPPYPKALLFDVFGTVVDWRGSVARAGEKLGAEKGLDVDWAAFADAWRGRYVPSMDRVRRGELPWTNLDDLHRASLEEVLDEFGVTGLQEDEKVRLNEVWHRLDPWPDTPIGLFRLKDQYIIAPLSNGNVRLLVDLARHAGLPWDLVLSAELARHYKPDREAYLLGPALLNLAPEEVMMVAAHPDDLRAAASCGLRTAYVSRPLEFGPGSELAAPDPAFDLVAGDFTELAEMLGA